MRWRNLASVVLCVSALACGGRMIADDAAPDDDLGGSAGARAGAPDRGGAPFGGRAGAGAGGQAARGGTSSAGQYNDPGCPTVEPPPPLVECDPLSPTPTCPPSEACYPYVEHPFGRGCGIATYGAYCALAGTGFQGDLCGDGTLGCAAQHLCVVGSHSGRRCARLCIVGGERVCSDGMICSETDVEGYGVCN